MGRGWGWWWGWGRGGAVGRMAEVPIESDTVYDAQLPFIRPVI